MKENNSILINFIEKNSERQLLKKGNSKVKSIFFYPLTKIGIRIKTLSSEKCVNLRRIQDDLSLSAF